MNSNTVEKAVSFSCLHQNIHGIYHDVVGAKNVCIMVVGGPQTRVGSHRMFVEIARMLAAQGISVLRFDYRGAGDSEGELQNFTDTTADIDAAVTYVQQLSPGLNSISLWGLCDAASAIAIYLNEYEQQTIDNVFLLNPWVKQAATEAQAIISHYYWQRIVNKSFWRKLFSGQVNPFKSAVEFLHHKKVAAQIAPTNSYVELMLDGLLKFKGKKHLILSENDLTAQEFAALRQQSPPWQALNLDTETTVNGANHTFASPHWKQQIGSLTFKAIISS